MFPKLKMLKLGKVQRLCMKKNFSTSKDLLLVQNLKDRTILQLSGQDAGVYLQGLITNDILHLQGASSSIFSLFLNSKGRILYDCLIYNGRTESKFYIECDKNVSLALKDHLLRYKVRRKVNVDSLDDELDIWTLIDNKNFLNIKDVRNYEELSNLLQKHLKDLIFTKDPRLQSLGLRIITPKNYNLVKQLQEQIDINAEQANFYKLHRFKLGVGEGSEELLFEKSFPMEVNGDYLNGISFHKGCYIGQELTARTYHTGVIRKRLMPLMFQKEVNASELGIPIFPVPVTEKPVGHLRGVEQSVGLGLLRIEEALKADKLTVLETKCNTERPFWWPISASQEKQKLNNPKTLF